CVASVLAEAHDHETRTPTGENHEPVVEIERAVDGRPRVDCDARPGDEVAALRSEDLAAPLLVAGLADESAAGREWLDAVGGPCGLEQARGSFVGELCARPRTSVVAKPGREEEAA